MLTKIKRNFKKLKKKIKYNNIYQEIFCKHMQKFRKAAKIKSKGICGLCGSKLVICQFQVHHIWSKFKYPKLKVKKCNGVCLCYPCHEFADNMNILLEN